MAWSLTGACLLGLLAGCGPGNGSTAGPRAAASASVPWSDRDDFETWEPPLPPGQDGWPTEPPSRWPGLRVQPVLPDTVQPGESVEYAVQIGNQSEEVIDLRPCGGYRQEVRVLGEGMASESVPGGESEFRLNCDDSPRLRAGEQRTYAMRLVVPEGLPSHDVQFTWGFVDNMPDYDAQEWIGLSS